MEEEFIIRSAELSVSASKLQEFERGLYSDCILNQPSPRCNEHSTRSLLLMSVLDGRTNNHAEVGIQLRV